MYVNIAYVKVTETNFLKDGFIKVTSTCDKANIKWNSPRSRVARQWVNRTQGVANDILPRVVT